MLLAELRPRIIIANPRSGRGRASAALKRLALGDHWDVQLTDAPGHAVELAQRAADAGARLVIALGGDGTAHEVANGILRSGNAECTFAPWPAGSANDYAYALGLPVGWLGRRDPWHDLTLKRVDVGRVTADTGRVGYTINCLGMGFNSAVTLESRRITWLRGMALYGLAFLRAVQNHYVFPPLTVTRDGETTTTPTLALSVNIGKREGGFLVTPDARLDDGRFDIVHAGPITRWKALTMLPRIATGTLPCDHPLLTVTSAGRVKVHSETPLRIHADGEFFCQPGDGVRGVDIEMLAKKLLVLTRWPLLSEREA